MESRLFTSKSVNLVICVSFFERVSKAQILATRVAIGDEVNGVADPDGIHVFRIGPGGRDEVERLHVDNPDGAVLATAIVAALFVPRTVHAVGHALAIGREFALITARQNERLFHATFGGHGPEARGGSEGAAVARGSEDDVLSIGRPALHGVGRGVPGEPLRFTAHSRDYIDIRVARELAAEGDPLAVGGKMRAAGLALEAGEAFRGTTLTADDPDVVGVGKSDLIRAHRGVAQHSCGDDGVACGGGGPG